MTEKSKMHPYAVTSFILGLLCIIPALNVVLSILAIIFGSIALKEIKHNPGQKGRALAIVGITIGAVVIVATIIYFIRPELLGIEGHTLFASPN